MTDGLNEENLILYLLYKNLYKATPFPKELVIEYELLDTLAQTHKVAPTVYKELLEEKDAIEIPKEITFYAKKIITAAMVIHSHIRQKLREFSELLLKNGIDFILIKGYAIDTSPLRQMNDIDVLIKEEEIDKAFEILQKAGYLYVGSFVLSQKEIDNPKQQYKWNNQYQFKVPQSQLVIEVHTNLFERDRIRTEKLDSLLDNVHLFWKYSCWDSELQCNTPVKEATLALLCMHSAIKYCPAVKLYILRQSYDIAKLLKKNIDEDYFMYLCRSWKIEYYVYFSMMLTSKIFHSQEAAQIALQFEPLLKWSEYFLACIHLKTYRGIERTSRFYRIIYAVCMPFILGGSFFKALRWYKERIFPPIYIQERRFCIKRTSPLIYFTYVYSPVRRIFRFIINKKLV